MNDLALPAPGCDSGADDTCLFGLSLCSGAGGIDLGLTLALPGYRAVGHVERETYAAATLVARMEDAALDHAPLWDDIATFDGKPWRGAVDIVSAGYPCQPFSVAGKRRGADDPELAGRLEILTSFPGIGAVTACMLLIEMPELGTLEPKQAASLAGLAPFTRRSGKWKGKEMIRGGRATLRPAIFMPALVAIRFNADLKRKYRQLIERGKAPKLAITMRKLVLLANALLRDGRKWADRPA